MKRNKDRVIILRRNDYSEADRIVNALSRERGKIGFIAKGSRRVKSKLASGIELFSECEVTTVSGRGDLETLTSARSDVFYKSIMRDLDIIESGYRYLQLTDKIFEQLSGAEFYGKLSTALKLLNNEEIHPKLVDVWFILQLSKETGNIPNLITDSDSNSLVEGKKYRFNIEEGNLSLSANGDFNTEVIKAWRVLLASNNESFLSVKRLEQSVLNTHNQARRFLEFHIAG